MLGLLARQPPFEWAIPRETWTPLFAMRYLKHYQLLFTAALLLVATLGSASEFRTVQPETVGISSERLDRLRDQFQTYVDEERLPGSTVLVARRGKIAFYESFGYRDLESKSPLRNDAIFRIASQSKAIISVGIMVLQEEGQLLISDPVGKYIPEFSETTVAEKTDDGYEVVKAKRKITIRDLLTHTAGIGYGGGLAKAEWEAAGITGWYFADRDEPIAETIKRIPSLPFDAQPGERFVYGYNTDILGAVIEAASGQALDQFLAEKVLRPLAMNDTHFYLPEAKVDRLATVYSSADNGLERAPDPGHMVGQGAYVKGPRKSFSGGAGFLSTANDYGRFLQMLLNGGRLDGQRVLAPSSVKLMTVDHIGDIEFGGTGVGFGLGFSVLKDLGARGTPGAVGEFGWGGAYHSTYWVDPKHELVVVYFTQLIPARGVDDHSKLRTLVYQALID